MWSRKLSAPFILIALIILNLPLEIAAQNLHFRPPAQPIVPYLNLVHTPPPPLQPNNNHYTVKSRRSLLQQPSSIRYGDLRPWQRTPVPKSPPPPF
uniref:Uncharacterized protein n=1 Tax=Cucumis melo TaxID=3656 RepID=A0A9I9E7R7_CUCME